MDFATVLKYNHNHGPDGRFASSDGDSGGDSEPEKNAKQWVGMMRKLREDQFKKHGVWNTDKFMEDHMKYRGKVVKGDVQMEAHNCFNNSAILAHARDYDVVDGYVSVHGVQIRHAWNIDDKGKQVDFTITDPEKWDYVGVKFPAKVAAKLSTTKQWGNSEGVIGTLQRLPEAKREKFLKDSGYVQ